MTTPPHDEQGETAPIELPGHPSPPPSDELPGHQPPPPSPSVPPTPAVAEPPEAPVAEPAAPPSEDAVDARPQMVARPVAPAQQEVMFVPLAVSVGDGFKFGCGFFLALVVAGLVAFVLFAALFVLTGLFGLNLPLTR